ncbi:MAG: AraC family transcriptional regulator [Christensenella sp.]|uniref:AraC family transcriptional regulator n=1 Tax=Christensenella sp. TaxID=1935934 RepID=UPI002B2007F2|nr:AraC family transcriptional regulator [Christensenella sp.]MEA5004252.1 AraC family transcriptional regulator [Christensenella sp.]
MRDLDKIQALVGPITAHDLKYVDAYVCHDVGIFIPSTGFCGYAIQPGHTHPSYSFMILLQKSSTVLDTSLQPDENHYIAAILPPDVAHEETTEDTFVRYIAIMASKQLVESVYLSYGLKPPHTQSWHDFFVPKEIMVFVSRFMEEYESNGAGRKTVLDAIGFLIVNDLIRNACQPGANNALPKSAAIRDAAEYIQQNFAAPISVRQLAQHVNLSVSAFSRRFFRETGSSPAAYLLAIRLNKSKSLLRNSEHSVTEIAQQCGFSSAAHLSSSFKKHYGLTPSAYRSLYANL